MFWLSCCKLQLSILRPLIPPPPQMSMHPRPLPPILPRPSHQATGAVWQAVSWTGEFRRRRQLLTLHWSYAPGENQVLTSSDGGNFQESAGWRKLTRTEPSFEDTVMFSEPVAAKAVKILMRGAMPWGYFGLAHAVAVSAPSPFISLCQLIAASF